MRVLVICKRQYTGRDLLDDSYGRLYEVPEALAHAGHQIRGLTNSYRTRPEGNFKRGEVTWYSFNGSPFGPRIVKHLKHIRQEIEDFCPDLVWASSDMWHGIACSWSCSQLEIPYVIDLYDNYESFLLSRLPGTRSLFRLACRHAIGLTSISERLSQFLQEKYNIPSERILTLGNATTPRQFFPIPQSISREKLGLPQKGMLMGTAGALGASRGLGVLLKALPLLKENIPELELVLAGPKERALKLPNLPYIRYLGELFPDQVSWFYNAMDLSIICNRESTFGTYCYPQKLNEILACNTRLLAANVGELTNLLNHAPQHLYDPQSPADLAKKACVLLQHPPTLPLRPIFWEQRATELARFFEERLHVSQIKSERS